MNNTKEQIVTTTDSHTDSMQNLTFENATGKIRFGMTNDYMFRAVLEANPIALKGLICSLLHLEPEEITSVVITNPFELGNSVMAKDNILDVKVCLNDSTFINLEMQVAKEDYWPERSLTYLCRSFDNLKVGESYENVRPAIHIGFLDYDLFPEHPEFYATYHLANDVTHRIYTSKFTLSVISLNQTNLATDEDKKYGIDFWAKLFKATTWEELRMIAETNNAIAETAKTMYKMSDDERVRQLCIAREEHYRILRGAEEKVQKTEARLTEMEEKLAEINAQIADKDAKLADKNAELADKNAELADKDAELADKDAELAKALARIAELEAKNQ